jgi:hypothetical protein
MALKYGTNSIISEFSPLIKDKNPGIDIANINLV